MRGLLIIFIFLTLGFYNSEASPQLPDFLIIGLDTLPLNDLPLYNLDSIRVEKLNENLQADNENFGSLLCLYRGYQAYWQIENNRLYLIGIKDYINSPKILKATFGSKYRKGKVLADWYSSKLTIPRGKLLRFDEYTYSSSFIKEEIFDFKNGHLISRKLVDNYIHFENGISRLDEEQLRGFLSSKISQIRIETSFQFCVTIDENGKISDITSDGSPYVEDYSNSTTTPIKWIDLFREKFKDLQFDIIKRYGEPYNEIIYMEISG